MKTTTIVLTALLASCFGATFAGAQPKPETFDATPPGWELKDSPGRGAAVRDGVLVVWIDNAAHSYQASSVRVPGEHSDVTVEAEVVKRSGAPTTAIGLICRDGASGRYFADVDEEGEVRLGANLDGQKILAKIERPGVWKDGANRLRLECVGENLAFSVNGERLLTATDGRLAAGSVGLRAGGAGRARTEAAFDNLLVTPR